MLLSRLLCTGVCLLALTACGGGGGDSPAATVAVTPALGKVQGATITLRSLQGSVIGSGYLGSEGSVRLRTGASLASGFIVELHGSNSAYYFDEGIGSVRPFGPGQVLHAISGGSRASVTVSALTELVYQRVVTLANGGAITADLIAQAENELRTNVGLAPGESPLDVPELVDNPLDLPGTDTWAGRYASRLSAWATYALAQRLAVEPDCLVDTSCPPLPGLIAIMAEDFTDGLIDGYASGTPLAGSPFSGDGPDAAYFFHEALGEAENDFRERVAAVLAATPGTDRLIGDTLAGNYALSCSRTLPTTSGPVPATVTVAADGSMSLRSGFGSFTLPAGGSFAHIAQVPVDGYVYAARSGQVVPAGLFNVSSGPVADGLSIVITPPAVGIGGGIILHEVPPAPYAGIALASAGESRIIVAGTSWSCATIAGSNTALVNTAERVADWLPDGDYRCESGGDPAQPRYVTLGSGTLTVQAPDYVPASGYVTLLSGTRMTAVSTSFYIPLTVDLLSHYSYALESVDDPLGLGDLEDWGHTHADDDVAATIYPHASLLLAVPPVTSGSATESLRVYRSLVTGKGYFEFTTDGLSLRHCQRVPAAGSSGTSSGSGVVVSGSGLSMSNVSLGSGGYGIYQSPYIGLTPYGGSTCYGNTAFC